MSDKFVWKESMFMMMRDNHTEKVNAEYVADVKAYLQAPVPACSKSQALKLLKQFSRKDFHIFWTDSVNRWTRKSGVDYGMIEALFGGLY